MNDSDQSNGKHVAIIGASSAIAEQCARIWAQDGASTFHLIGRDIEKLQAIADDLKVRNPAAAVNCVRGEFHDGAAIESLVQSIVEQHLPDIVLIAHGNLPDQPACQASLNTTRDALLVNGISPVLFAEAFVRHMALADRGTLALIGSVAGDRGRKSNYVYGAAKGLVTRYAQGLQHRLAGSNVTVVLIKPGPTYTPMTAHLKKDGAKLANVTDVATAIVNGIDKQKPLIYVPGKWALIMMIIRHLPRFVFNKMDI